MNQKGIILGTVDGGREQSTKVLPRLYRRRDSVWVQTDSLGQLHLYLLTNLLTFLVTAHWKYIAVLELLFAGSVPKLHSQQLFFHPAWQRTCSNTKSRTCILHGNHIWDYMNILPWKQLFFVVFYCWWVFEGQHAPTSLIMGSLTTGIVRESPAVLSTSDSSGQHRPTRDHRVIPTVLVPQTFIQPSVLLVLIGFFLALRLPTGLLLWARCAGQTAFGGWACFLRLETEITHDKKNLSSLNFVWWAEKL